MGLASKLAESQRQGGYNALPPQQQQAGYRPQPGAYPGQSQYQPTQYQQSQYQPYPGNNSAPSGQYPPNQVLQYPPQQQQQYQQGPGQYGQQPGYPPVQANPQQLGAYKQLLQTTIQQKSLQNMIPLNHPVLDQYAQRAASQVDHLVATRQIEPEIGRDLVKLALFDIILYIDNSASMAHDEGPKRINDLRNIMTSVVNISMLFDDDGISIRFMNDWDSNPAMDGVDMRRLDNIKDERMIEHIVGKIQYTGITPLGAELRNKVIDPMVLGPARNRQLQKPVLVITITDGQPTETDDVVKNVVQYASNELSRMPQYGPGAVSFQFAQVGNDQPARAWLAKIDSDPQVGYLVDCTSNYENEEMEIRRSAPTVKFTHDIWMAKMLLGSIDSSYDSKDESGFRPPGGQSYGVPAPAQGIYGAPGGYSQQQYPPQQGSYGQLPQEGYGQPPSAGPYGQQGYGQTQPGYSQPPSQSYAQTPQTGHGQPPVQYHGQQPPPQGYPHSQQSNYNPPPPPPRY